MTAISRVAVVGSGVAGTAAAILLGDLLLSWSDELLRGCGLPADRVATALGLFDRCRTEVITGQFLDVSVQARGRADVEAAMTVLRFKSAKYSIERPLHIGAAPEADSMSLAMRLLGRLTSPSQAASRAEMQIRLQDALNAMDPIDREVLALRHFEELSNRETAEVLGLQQAAASNRYVRALRRLKEILSADSDLLGDGFRA